MGGPFAPDRPAIAILEIRAFRENVAVARSGLCDFNVLTGNRFEREEPLPILFRGEFEVSLPLKIIVRLRIDKTHDVGCASGKRSLTEHDTSMDDNFVEHERVARLEIIFDLVILEYLAHGRRIEDPITHGKILTHARLDSGSLLGLQCRNNRRFNQVVDEIARYDVLENISHSAPLPLRINGMQRCPHRATEFFCDLIAETLYTDMLGKPFANVFFDFKTKFKGQKEVVFDQICQTSLEERPFHQFIDFRSFGLEVIVRSSEPRIALDIHRTPSAHFDFDAIEQRVNHVGVQEPF